MEPQDGDARWRQLQQPGEDVAGNQVKDGRGLFQSRPVGDATQTPQTPSERQLVSRSLNQPVQQVLEGPHTAGWSRERMAAFSLEENLGLVSHHNADLRKLQMRHAEEPSSHISPLTALLSRQDKSELRAVSLDVQLPAQQPSGPHPAQKIGIEHMQDSLNISKFLHKMSKCFLWLYLQRLNCD